MTFSYSLSYLRRRAVKVMRFQRGQEAALVRGLVRQQLHRQKQESVLWQHSPTQGSSDRYRVVCYAYLLCLVRYIGPSSFRTNAVDAWDLAMPGQVRQYSSPPGYQSDEYGVRQPFALSPAPVLALKYVHYLVRYSARSLPYFCS